MKQCFRLFMSAIFLLGCFRSSAQNVTNKGKDFWVGYGHHQFMEPSQSNSQEMVLYFSADQAAQVRVTIYGRNATQVLNYSVPANTVISSATMPKSGSNDVRLYDVPPSFGGNGGEGLFPLTAGNNKQSIHIESDVPIVAYAHIYGSVSSGATMLLPTPAWGYSYYTINSQQIDAGGPGFSWVYVIAKEDNTKIEITPFVQTRLGKPAGVPFTVTMNKGQIYQIVGQSDGSGNGNQFTRTGVKSVANSSGQCYPIAVFSGSSRTRGESVPCGSGSGRDNDMQQCFPYTAWGKRYLTAPFSSSNGSSLSPSNFQTSVYKIIAKDPANTTVRRNGAIITPNATGWWQFSSNTGELIESDQPIMVAQFMSGSSTCNPGSSGDPEMVYLSPIEQAINSVGFFRNNKESIASNYVTGVIPTAGLQSLVINGQTFPGCVNYSAPHPRLAGYSIFARGWSASQAQVLMRSDSSFTAVTYGLGSAESYGYNAGTYLKNLNAIANIENVLDTSTARSHRFTCTKTPVKLSVLMAYKPLSINWHLSALSSVLTPANDVLMAPAVPNDTVYRDGIKYYMYTLRDTFVFSQPGVYNIPLTTTSPTIDNCSSSEGLFIEVDVKQSPKVDFTYNAMNCSLDSLHLRGSSLITPFVAQQYWYSFPPDTAKRRGVNLDTLLTPNCYQIKLSSVSSEGCLGDTTKTVCLTAGPATFIIANDTTICVGDSITFTSGSGGPGTWGWNYGVSPTNSIYTTAGNHTVRYDTAGTFVVKHWFNSGGSCQTDTARLTIFVFPKPKPSFTVPDSCLGPGSSIAFTNTTSVPDTQTIRTWAWNFNDPLSGGANTSSVKDPTHLYASAGSYNVVLGATTYNGCFKDTTITIQVKQKPTLSYGSLAPICQSAGGTVSVASAVVTNSLPGTGVYSGPGTDAAGNFDPAIAGPGTHTIKYVFTTAAGCSDSVTTTIRVATRPTASFTWPNGGCLNNGDVTFTSTSITPAGTTLTYSWNFGDANASGSNPNTSTGANPTHTFQPGTYSIRLTVTTNEGCAHDTTMTAVFAIKPQLAYSAIAPVCENATGTVSVANGSVTNSIQGTGEYHGSFTDLAGNFNPSASGAGTYTIWYVFTPQFGTCKDSISQTITVKPRPHANFTVPGMGCLINDTVQFTNTSTIIGNLPMTYSWNFGDANATPSNPNTSTLANPKHVFQTSTYSIQLSASASNGCTGDTTITLTFTIKPNLTYGSLAPVCVNQAGTVNVAQGAVTNSVPGTGIYHGPGTDAAGNFNPAAAGVGTHTIWYVFNASGGTCRDSVSQTILVRDRPHPNFTFPAGCLPVTGLIQFTNATTIGDGQAMTYGWDFNDPNASAGNPNTSTQQNPTHTFQNTGTYNIKLTATTANGCIADTTITATLSVKPQLAWNSLAAVCENAATVSVATATVQNGVTGTGTYGGSPAVTAAGQFNPAAAGTGVHTIKYYFTSTGGCVDSIAQTITVNARPRPNFTFPNGLCMVNGLVAFTNTSTISGNTPMTYAWDFGHPASGASNTSTAQNPSHTFDDASYSIKLTATSNQGCVADTTIQAVFSIKPQVAYPAVTAVCENSAGTFSVATATVTNGLTGTGVYSGTGTDAAGNFNPSAVGAGTYPITYIFTTASGCADTASINVTVKPRPHPNFTYPAGGCLDTGLVQLNNITPAMSGNTFTWGWDFGDANATGANPNTSTLQNPTHTFGTGPYSIKLTASASNGCSGDTTITANFSVKPKLYYVAPAPVCASVAGTVSIATAVVTNGVPGNGVYSGTGVDAAGNFNPSQAGAGTHQITYTFTSSAGCVKDTTVQILVHPKPTAFFNVTPDICINKLATITDASTVATGSLSTWNWDLGNSQTPSYNNNAPFTTGYNTAGVDTIKLTVVSDKGCTSDPYKKNLTVHPLPVANFTMPVAVCLPGGGTRFTSTSTVGDGSSMTYQWNFGDMTTGNGSPVSHVYVDSNAYSVTLTVTSAFGCVKDTTQVMSAFFRKPVANFTVNAAELCQGQESLFTDLSTASGSTIVRRLWNFGDNTTDTVANPKVVYANPGTFTVNLRVTNAAGCSADTSKQVKVNLQPIVDAGPSFVVPLGSSVRFNPTVNATSLQLTWTPAAGLSGATLLRPTILAAQNGIYYLTAVGAGGCTATDSLTVTVLLPVKIPNAFSPNGDGTHDTWAIENLKDYPNAKVEVFNRYGQKVYESHGYSSPWDGRFNGSVLPFATYYYVVTLSNGFTPMTGSLTIIR